MQPINYFPVPLQVRHVPVYMFNDLDTSPIPPQSMQSTGAELGSTPLPLHTSHFTFFSKFNGLRAPTQLSSKVSHIVALMSRPLILESLPLLSKSIEKNSLKSLSMLSKSRSICCYFFMRSNGSKSKPVVLNCSLMLSCSFALRPVMLYIIRLFASPSVS